MVETNKVIAEMDLEGRLRFEADAMQKAMHGEIVDGTSHLSNWGDKPHRVVFDAADLLIKAADSLAAIKEEIAFQKGAADMTKRGCHCCPDYHADRADARSDFAQELLEFIDRLKIGDKA